MSSSEPGAPQQLQFHILDGTQLISAVDLSLPPHDPPDAALTGSQLLHLAHSRASSSLFGLPLPPFLTANAFTRLRAADADAFRSAQFPAEDASHFLRDYVAAIADELKDNPLVVSVWDGSTLRLFLEDEDDFAMLAEDLFTDLDAEDKGKISKSEIRNALVKMGVDMGVPPFSEFPQLDDLLRKHGADREEELGQAQFAQLLQSVLQELAEELSQKNVVSIQNMKVVNGSKLRQLMANEKELNTIAEKVLQERPKAEDNLGSTEIIRKYLERNGQELGLPPYEADEALVHLYADVFADIGKDRKGLDLESRDELVKLLKDVLERFAENLESNPVLCQDFSC